MNLSGWLIIDKPHGISSAQAIGMIKRRLGGYLNQKLKIGHTGTLDPFATGILPLALGEATKLTQFFLECKKTYQFTLAWGAQRSTGDLEGDIISKTDYIPRLSEIEQTIAKFLGSQAQIPPKYSAIKIAGQRAYQLARKGVDFDLQARNIHIHDFQLIEHNSEKNETCFNVTCSKGTYIRTLGQDFAYACGSLGHLSALRRIKVGFFSQDAAILPDSDEKMIYKALLDVITPLSGISAYIVDDIQEKALRFGQKIPQAGDLPNRDIFPIMSQDQQLVALGSVHDGMIKPRRVFNL